MSNHLYQPGGAARLQAAVGDEVRERLALDEGAGEVAGALVLAEVVDGHDVGVQHLGRRGRSERSRSSSRYRRRRGEFRVRLRRLQDGE